MVTSARFFLLGGFELHVDGAVVGPDDFERRSGAELLQLLAVTTGHRLHREQIMEALWPGADSRSAGNSLRKAATFARRATDAADAIVVEGQVVALFPASEVEVDVEVVEAASAGDERSVTAAVDAYRGELLPDLPYAEWAVRARRRLRQHMTAVLAATRRWDDLLALDPGNEEAIVALMDRALADGDRQTVLRRYDELEAHLRDELGITPGRTAVVLRDRALDPAISTGDEASGVRTFLMTGIEGPTRAPEGDPAGGAARRALHDRLVDEAVERHGGVVVETDGDGGCAVFASASDAVHAAVAIQLALQAATWEGERPRVSVGLDVGEATYRDGRWSGVPLDRTARILDVASGDQIVCSELVAGLATPGLGPGTTTVELGRFRLADLAPATLHRVEADGIEQRAGLRAAPLSGRPLGPSRDLLIGRAAESSDLERLLTTERLLTIVGPGGAGKTHLARHVAGSVAGTFPGGTWMCRFGTVDDGRAVAQELLTAIGAVQHTDATAVESIVRSLGDRHTLIVLDNCEHLLASIVAVSREILDRCPGVTLLATSREPLGLAAERQFRLGELSRDASVELFVTTARRQGASLDPTDATVARICHRLDDLPLAVQLAAARARTLDPGTIESLLDDRLTFLASSTKDRPDHHRTLEAAIAWSFDALLPELQQLLVDLSVLTGRFTLDEARAVAGAAGTPLSAFVDGLEVLVRRSLVAGPDRVGDEPVYHLLESIRLFARARGGRDAALDRHLTHFCEAAEAARRLQQHDSLAGLQWFRSRWGDLRQAQAHAVASGRLADLCRIINAASHHGAVTGELELVDWCERGLDPAQPVIHGPAHVAALANWALLGLHRGEVELAEALVAQASAADPDHAEVLRARALISWSRGDHAEAVPLIERILEQTDLEPSLEAGLLMFEAILVSGTGGDIAPIADRLASLAAGRGPVFDARALFVEAVANAWTDPELASARLDECQYLTDRHDLIDIGAAVRLVRAWVSPRTEAGPNDVLVAIGGNIDWLRERGLWSYALVQVGVSALTFASVDRIDLTVTLLSSCAANGFTTNFQSDLTESLLAEARATHGGRYDEWWEHGQRLDPAAACRLALTGVDQLPTR